MKPHDYIKNIMKSKLFWKARHLYVNMLFSCRRIIYSYGKRRKENGSFAIGLVRLVTIGICKNAMVVAALYIVDRLLITFANLSFKSTALLIDLLIGTIGIAGVMFGLYCSSIVSVYSTKYVDAPSTVRIAFQSDIRIRKCTNFIINYIIFAILTMAEILIVDAFSWATLIAVFLGIIGTIVSYQIANYRAYELSDILRSGDDSYREILRIVTGPLIYEPYSSDYSFQVHFQTKCEKLIILLKELINYSIATSINEKGSNTSMCEYICKNNLLVSAYMEGKNKISRNSAWYKIINKYKRWHLAKDFEVSTALQTGTGLQPREEHDYWWFENAVLSINKIGVSKLCNDSDFENMYKYISSMRCLCEPAINAMEANYYAEQVAYIKDEVSTIDYKLLSTKDDNNDLLVGMVDMISLLYLETILASNNYLKKLSILNIIKDTKDSIASKENVESTAILRSSSNSDLYNKLKKEYYIEGKIITPEWVIAQAVAKEQYTYINNLSNLIRECLDSYFNLGIAFDKSNRSLEACIVFIRFYEVESKVARFMQLFQNTRAELLRFHVDEADKWGQNKFDEVSKTLGEWKNTITPLLMKNSSKFALDTWNKKDDYPDLIGDTYNHICEDAIESIANNDFNMFSTDFESLTKLMILYQEYIRSDFIEKTDLYRIEYQYYVFTYPIVEWAQIGGLAILWGEFNGDNKWVEHVKQCTNSLLSDEKQSEIIATKIIEYVNNRNQFWIGIGQRDVLETGWNMTIANAIRNSDNYKTTFEGFHKRVETESELFEHFCGDSFDEFGFMSDPAEVFWVLCINPKIPEPQRFKSRLSWEEYK